jgi:hypothetical protein
MLGISSLDSSIASIEILDINEKPLKCKNESPAQTFLNLCLSPQPLPILNNHLKNH